MRWASEEAAVLRMVALKPFGLGGLLVLVSLVNMTLGQSKFEYIQPYYCSFRVDC